MVAFYTGGSFLYHPRQVVIQERQKEQIASDFFLKFPPYPSSWKHRGITLLIVQDGTKRNWNPIPPLCAQSIRRICSRLCISFRSKYKSWSFRLTTIIPSSNYEPNHAKASFFAPFGQSKRGVFNGCFIGFSYFAQKLSSEDCKVCPFQWRGEKTDP